MLKNCTKIVQSFILDKCKTYRNGRQMNKPVNRKLYEIETFFGNTAMYKVQISE